MFNKIGLILVIFIVSIISFESEAFCIQNPINMFKGNISRGLGDTAYFENKNYPVAFKEYKRSAEAGDEHGQFMLANMYLEGKGTRKDRKEFIYWMSKSAANGNSSANYLLGMLIIKNDPTQAVKYFKKAARKKHGASMHMLGLMNQRGCGVKRNPRQAQKWFNLAEKNGIPISKKSYKKKTPRRVNSFVVEIQTLLTKLGYNPGPADGLYGNKTKTEIIKFQRKMGMKEDGIANVELLRVLRGSVSH